jgi:hypothetical protein
VPCAGRGWRRQRALRARAAHARQHHLRASSLRKPTTHRVRSVPKGPGVAYRSHRVVRCIALLYVMACASCSINVSDQGSPTPVVTRAGTGAPAERRPSTRAGGAGESPPTATPDTRSGHVLLVGDSLTFTTFWGHGLGEGAPAELDWSAWLGWTVADVQPQVERAAAANRLDTLVVALGTNDSSLASGGGDGWTSADRPSPRSGGPSATGEQLVGPQPTGSQQCLDRGLADTRRGAVTCREQRQVRACPLCELVDGWGRNLDEAGVPTLPRRSNPSPATRGLARPHDDYSSPPRASRNERPYATSWFASLGSNSLPPGVHRDTTVLQPVPAKVGVRTRTQSRSGLLSPPGRELLDDAGAAAGPAVPLPRLM